MRHCLGDQSSLFELIQPEDRLQTYYDQPVPTTSSVLLLVDSDIHNFTVTVESSKLHIAFVLQVKF